MPRIYFFLLLAAVSGVLHLVWENAHVSLYGGYEHLTALPITFYATIGDVGYVIGAVLFVSLFKGGVDWLRMPSRLDLAGLVMLGIFISLYVEYKALAFNKWFYLDAMPMIPMLDVGLTPVIQMMVLLPLSVWIAGRLHRAIFGQ